MLVVLFLGVLVIGLLVLGFLGPTASLDGEAVQWTAGTGQPRPCTVGAESSMGLAAQVDHTAGLMTVDMLLSLQ